MVTLPKHFKGIMPGGSHGHAVCNMFDLRHKNASSSIRLDPCLLPDHAIASVMFPFVLVLTFPVLRSTLRRRTASCDSPALRSSCWERDVFLLGSNPYTLIPPVNRQHVVLFQLPYFLGSRKISVCIVAGCG